MVGRQSCERIYIGGLDPNRGLTVELVSSRLRSVKGVELLSINDVAIGGDDGRHTNVNKHSSIYDAKRMIVDEDGDLVDTRNFFYVEARPTAASATEEATALDLLSKQYNGVKWKGCQLRVEAARPHFLKRLDEERRESALARCAERKEEKSEDVGAHGMGENEAIEDDGANKDGGGTSQQQVRRRLRIRKRFGEEAYHVDTLPHPLELSNNERQLATSTGWEDFAALHKRMKNKRQSQQEKLVERRKKERRLWASGKGGSGGKADSSNSNADGSDDLRSLIFLNRGIHIRFSDHPISVSSRRVDTDDVKEVTSGPAGSHAAKHVQEDQESDTSPSSTVSSDSEESSGHQLDPSGAGKDAYVWSDDDESEDGSGEDQSDVSDEEIDASDGETGAKHARSSEGDDGDSSGGQGRVKNDNAEKYYDDLDMERIKPIGGKKMMDGSAYTKAAAIDEFSGGMDFGQPLQDDFEADESIGSEDAMGSNDASASQLCLEDDIRSNMGILGMLFPDEQFDQQPRVASIDGDSFNTDGNGVTIGSRASTLSPAFGGGLIMQRYDPTKEADKKFELPHADKSTGVPQPPLSSEESEEAKEAKGSEDEAVSSESSDEDGSTQGSAKPELQCSISNENANKTPTAEAVVEGNDLSAKDVYEQDKLDDIFKEAREGKTESFSLAGLFRAEESKDQHVNNEESMKGDVYEQDKLEDVFKQARAAGNAGAGGFTFGFQSQLPADSKATGGAESSAAASFSFGFDLGKTNRTDDKHPIPPSPESTQGIRANSLEAHEVKRVLPTPVKEADEQAKRRIKRVGMAFPESDLQKYEDMFFSLNEAPQILKDLDGMKQNEENQERWQKERQVLTADWKRKQKAALSRKKPARGK